MWNRYVHVDDVAAIAERATSLGGKITTPVQVMDAEIMAYKRSQQYQSRLMAAQPAYLTGVPGSMCWSELATRDLTAAQSFFEELFGWSYFKHEHSPMEYYYIMHGEIPIGGMFTMNEQMENIPPYWGVYFSVEDIEASTQKVTDLKRNVLVQPFDIPTVSRMSVVSDPQGAAYSMIQMATEVPS